MHKSVNIIVKNSEGKFILQMRDGTPGICNPLKWNFFGGKIEPNEDPLSATIREFKEETDILLSPNDCSLKAEMVALDNKGIVYLYEITKPIELDEIRLLEGAGLGAFTLKEASLIEITVQTQKQFELI
ncbi:MAG: NUDIX domain-containing protein [Bacteriovoracaceae bacterium]